VLVSAYNDPHVVAGQASLVEEIVVELGPPGTVVAPAGSGGLLAGLSIALSPECRLIGVGAEASPALHRSVIAGESVEVDVKPTLADGLAGNLEPGAIPVTLLARRNPVMFDASEDAIAAAIRFLAYDVGLVVEGSAAIAFVPFLDGRLAVSELAKPVVIVVTGRNISAEALRDVLRS
jgi:threonine dehydratase